MQTFITKDRKKTKQTNKQKKTFTLKTTIHHARVFLARNGQSWSPPPPRTWKAACSFADQAANSK